MSALKPVTREQYGARRWLRPPSYAFAMKDTVAPLVASELSQAAVIMPIGFINQGEDFVPAAVVGLMPGQSLFVSNDGRWLAHYVPSNYRCYPFALASSNQGGDVLCIDEDSGLVTSDPDGQPFFDDDTKPSKLVADIFASLQEISAHRAATKNACRSLKTHGLIQPWPITIQTPSGDKHVEGLHCINEEAMNVLSDEAFLELRAARGLTVAFCQLLSMQHLPGLKQEAISRATAPASGFSTASGFEVLDDDRPLDFSKFR